jgi:hypothetical protein
VGLLKSTTKKYKFILVSVIQKKIMKDLWHDVKFKILWGGTEKVTKLHEIWSWEVWKFKQCYFPTQSKIYRFLYEILKIKKYKTVFMFVILASSRQSHFERIWEVDCEEMIRTKSKAFSNLLKKLHNGELSVRDVSYKDHLHYLLILWLMIFCWLLQINRHNRLMYFTLISK